MLKWGIVGAGKIAHSFVKDLLLLEDNEVAGIASRKKSKAIGFINEYDLSAKAFGSYQELFLDPNIDIVYIATPHNSHKQLSIEAMSHGKHVLCEKPMAVNVMDAKEMVAVSQKNNVFLMEAMWSRFNPTIQQVNNLLSNGAIGEISYLNADFSHLMTGRSIESRLYNMDLAGGALLDIGIYPIFLSYLILGMPSKIEASARFHNTGADVQTSAILKYDDATTTIFCNFEAHSDMEAKIFGTEGKITINNRWHETESFTIEKDGYRELIQVPKLGRGYAHEIIECQKQIEAGQIESDLWSHEDSINLISILDQIRSIIGLKYPFED